MTKLRSFIAFTAIALTVSACAPGTRVGDLLNLAQTTITNPVTATNIYQVKNAYAAALQLAVEYRSYCWSKPYAALLKDPIARPLCQNRRAVVRSIQAADRKASAAIAAAESFISNHPTLDASAVVAAAWNAVSLFNVSIPKA